MDLQKKIFVQLIQENQGILQSLIKVYYTREADQEDARQDIILQLWKAFPSFREEAKVSTWIYRIALNTILSKRKAENRRIQPLGLDQLSVQPKSISYSDDDSQLLKQIINQLGDDDKALLVLHLEGYKNKEIAEILGHTATNISTRLHRIKTHLKNRYKNYHHASK